MSSLWRRTDVSERMHQRVCPIVDEDHPHDGTGSILVLRVGVIGAGTGPASEDDGHTDEGHEVLCAPSEYLGEKGATHTCYQIPAGER